MRPAALFSIAIIILVSAMASASEVRAAENGLSQGGYLVRIMDCSGCHTPGALRGQPDPTRFLGGGDVGIQIPGLGTFFAPNLTTDRATGLGDWSVDEIIQAVPEGVQPDGRELAPIMPWRSYAVLNDGDARALALYLKSLPAIVYTVPGPFGPGETPDAPYLAPVNPD